MTCSQCQRELRDDSTFCSGCGAPQRPDAGRRATGADSRGGTERTADRLQRSRTDRRVAGVCGGIAEYLRVDPTFIRAGWLILSVVPGAVVGGILAYLLAWLVIPDADGREAAPGTPRPRRLCRSATDRRVAGVCGGIAEYFEVDATPVRLLWVILSVVPGAVLGGLAVYVAAWLIMPAEPRHVQEPAVAG